MELGRRESHRAGFLSRLRRWLTIGCLVAFAYLVWVKFEWWPPTAELRKPLEYAGRRTQIALDVHDRGSGLRSVEVAIEAGGTSYRLLSEEYPASSWRGSSVHDKSFDVALAPREAKIPEGKATLVVRAVDYSWLNFLRRRPPVLAVPIEVDTTPPTIEVLTTQHYMRLGGSDMVVYKTSKDASRSGVEVDRYFFPGTKGLVADPDVTLAVFAVPQDLTTHAHPRIVAEDRAGNRRDADFHVSIKPRHFADKTLEIDDDFLQRKVPDLLQINGLSPTDDLVAGYLAVNRDLRKSTEQKISELCSHSESKLLWDEVFLRQPNSAPLSSFADRRTYTHRGDVIDTQTHLGFDLASLPQSVIPAANNGKIVHAGNLGIYGNAVIIDHGLGIFTLYGHMSSITVSEGQTVRRGETIGRTGQTGLAGGDHLHFSVMLWGHHVDPVEWWDPQWVDDHVLAKIREFGHAGSPKVEPAATEAKRDARVEPIANGPKRRRHR